MTTLRKKATMRTSPHTTAIARIVVAAVTLVALTGCVRVHTDLTLNNDNTASGEIIFAVSDEFAESLGMTPEEVADALLTTGDGAADQGIGAGATSEEPYQEDSYTGTRYVFEATPSTTPPTMRHSPSSEKTMFLW